MTALVTFLQLPRHKATPMGLKDGDRVRLNDLSPDIVTCVKYKMSIDTHVSTTCAHQLPLLLY